jgi:hypothetical protein
MSTQINPVRNTVTPATREVPPVPLAERVKKMDKAVSRDDDRQEPVREEAAIVIEQRVPTADTLVVNMPFSWPNARPPLDGGEPEPVVAMASHVVVTGQGPEGSGGTWLPTNPYSLGRVVVSARPGDTPTAVVEGRSDPMPLPVVAGQEPDIRPIASAPKESARPPETKAITEDGKPSSESWPRTSGVGQIVPRPSGVAPIVPSSPGVEPIVPSGPNTLPPRAEGDAVVADESGSSQGGETRPSSIATPHAPVPSPSPGIHEGRSGAASLPGTPPPPPPPPQSSAQARPAEAPSAPSELTFTFNSWGHGQAVTATLARSGYVYLTPSSARVGDALMASKPEERWLIERTAATGEDDNHGKQRRKRQ